MSSEVVVKKRGRPKKADTIEQTARKSAGEVAVATSKRSTATRSITTKATSSTETVLKKPARRKKPAETDDVAAAEELPLTINGTVDDVDSKVPSKAARQPLASKILEKARAFTTAPASALAGSSGHGEVKLPSTATPSPSSSQPLPSTHGSIASQPQTSSPDPPSGAINNAAQSSFLSGFLSDTPDVIPEAPESSKIVDRSAFNAQNISADDIVSGAGITDLTSLTAAIEQKSNTKRARESAIPITPPKAFKSHNLSTFPDKPEPQQVKTPPAQKYVNPGTYALASFRSFKATPQSAPEQPQSTPTIPLSNAAALSTKPSPHLPPTSAMSPAHQPHHPQRVAFHTSLTSQLPRQPAPPHPKAPASTPLDPLSTPTTTRPKRPTEMTPAELLKNPQFRSLRRKYTGLIVGIPVLVATSWVLWGRLEQDENGFVPEKARGRGELPRRILDDGGLERVQNESDQAWANESVVQASSEDR